MEKRYLLAGSLILLVILCSNPGTIKANIEGSKDDFSGSGWTTEICEPCHTPHNADTTVIDAPLWNHQVQHYNAILYENGNSREIEIFISALYLGGYEMK